MRQTVILIVLLALASLGTAEAEEPLFDVRVNYPTGYRPTSVISADFNGDECPDVAVSRFYNDNLGIMLNAGNGTLLSPIFYPTGDAPRHIVPSDLDGDSDIDMVVANDQSDNVSILLNNGNATFTLSGNYSAGDQPWSVCTGDFDGDSDDDIAVANARTDNVSVMYNSGTATFAGKVNYPAGDGPHSVISARIDGDDNLDLVVANFYSNNISVLLNNGDGTFAPRVNYAAGGGPSSVVAADLDGDLDQDLAVTNAASDRMSILLNNGDGTFGSAVAYVAGDYAYDAYAADFDGDHDQDVAVVNYNSGNLSVFLNNGDGSFAGADNYGTGSGPHSIFSSDFDLDRDYDLVVANHGSDNISILFNLADIPHSVELTPGILAFTTTDDATEPPDSQLIVVSSPCEWGTIEWDCSLVSGDDLFDITRITGADEDTLIVSATQSGQALGPGTYSGLIEVRSWNTGYEDTTYQYINLSLFVGPGVAVGEYVVESGVKSRFGIPIRLHSPDSAACQFVVPLKYYTTQPGEVRVDSVKAYDDSTEVIFDPNEQIIIVTRPIQEPPLPDTSAVLDLACAYFTVTEFADAEMVLIDTATITYGDDTYSFFLDIDDYTFNSGKIVISESECCNLRGDLDHNGTVDPIDVTYFVNWLWKGGPGPVCLDEADVNGDGDVNPQDCTYFVNYMWKGGPAPVPCP